MSALVVSKTHIDLLITAGLVFPELHCQNSKLRWRTPNTNPPERMELDFGNADKVGVMLWAENVRSVDHAYPDADEEGLPGPENFSELHSLTYEWARIPGRLDPLAVIKATQCYEYQSCEHSEWKTSSARAFCQALTRVSISLLPGYDKAPWSFDDADYFLTVAA